MSYRFIPWSDCDGVWYGYHRYLWDFLRHIYSGDNWCGGWQLMWPFRFVVVPFCGRFGFWPFRFMAVPVCGRSGLWPFRCVAVPVCGRFSLWPFRFVAVSVVAVSVCGRYDLLPFYRISSPVHRSHACWPQSHPLSHRNLCMLVISIHHSSLIDIHILLFYTVEATKYDTQIGNQKFFYVITSEIYTPMCSLTTMELW